MVQLAPALHGARIGTLGISRGRGWMGALAAPGALVREDSRSAKRRWHHERRAPRRLRVGGGQAAGVCRKQREEWECWTEKDGEGWGGATRSRLVLGRVLRHKQEAWQLCPAKSAGRSGATPCGRGAVGAEGEEGGALKPLLPVRRLEGTLCCQQDVHPRATGAQERLTCASPEGAYIRGASTARGPIRKSNAGT